MQPVALDVLLHFIQVDRMNLLVEHAVRLLILIQANIFRSDCHLGIQIHHDLIFDILFFPDTSATTNAEAAF